MEVACILDVWPLASRPPIEGQGSGTARERPSVAKGAVEGQIWHLGGGGSRSSTKRHKALTHDPSKKSREKRSQIEESSDKRKTKEKAPKITKKD
jgi:hypothetical protein